MVCSYLHYDGLNKLHELALHELMRDDSLLKRNEIDSDGDWGHLREQQAGKLMVQAWWASISTFTVQNWKD